MKTLSTRFLIAVLVLAACSSGGDKTKGDSTNGLTTSATSDAGSSDCLEGTWKMEENGVTRTFTFRPDKSGDETYAPDDVRPFTWSMKDASTVHIVYTPHGDTKSSEWDLGVDCATGTLSFSGAKYHK